MYYGHRFCGQKLDSGNYIRCLFDECEIDLADATFVGCVFHKCLVRGQPSMLLNCILGDCQGDTAIFINRFPGTVIDGLGKIPVNGPTNVVGYDSSCKPDVLVG